MLLTCSTPLRANVCTKLGELGIIFTVERRGFMPIAFSEVFCNRIASDLPDCNASAKNSIHS